LWGGRGEGGGGEKKRKERRKNRRQEGRRKVSNGSMPRELGRWDRNESRNTVLEMSHEIQFWFIRHFLCVIFMRSAKQGGFSEQSKGCSPIL